MDSESLKQLTNQTTKFNNTIPNLSIDKKQKANKSAENMELEAELDSGNDIKMISTINETAVIEK